MRKIVFDFKETKQEETPIRDDNREYNTAQKDSIEEMFDYINNIILQISCLLYIIFGGSTSFSYQHNSGHQKQRK